MKKHSIVLLLCVLGAVFTLKAQAFHLEIQNVKTTVITKSGKLNNVNVYWAEWTEKSTGGIQLKFSTDDAKPGFVAINIFYSYSKVLERKSVNGMFTFVFDVGTPDERTVQTSSKTFAAIIRLAYDLKNP